MNKILNLMLCISVCVATSSFAAEIGPVSSSISPPITAGEPFHVLAPGYGIPGTVNTLTSLGIEASGPGVFLGSTVFQNMLQPVTAGGGGILYNDASSVKRVHVTDVAGVPNQITSTFPGGTFTCSLSTVTIKDSTGTTVNSDFDRAFVLSGSANCSYYTTSNCKFNAAAISINAGASSGSLYMKCSTTGSVTVTDIAPFSNSQPVPLVTGVTGSI